MLRDGHFDGETHAQAVRLTASDGPASDHDHIEIDDQVAHTGDTKVDIDGNDGNVFSATDSLMTDGNVGAFQVQDGVTGTVIGNVTSTGSVLSVTPAVNFRVLAQEAGKSPAPVHQALAAAQVLFPVYQAVQAQTPQPPAPPQRPQGPQQQQNTSCRFLTSNLLLYGAG